MQNKNKKLVKGITVVTLKVSLFYTLIESIDSSAIEKTPCEGYCVCIVLAGVRHHRPP